MNLYRVLTIANAALGAILAASGAITAYAGTLGAYRPVSVVLAGLGVAQLVAVNILHSVSGPPAAVPRQN